MVLSVFTIVHRLAKATSTAMGCCRWLAVDEGDGKTCVTLRPADAAAAAAAERQKHRYRVTVTTSNLKVTLHIVLSPPSPKIADGLELLHNTAA